MGDDESELQLLLPLTKRIHLTSATEAGESKTAEMIRKISDNPPLDLSLSINTRTVPPARNDDTKSSLITVEALKQQAAEQVRLAAMEKAYAERVRELTKVELEVAEKEFARARLIWERAQEDLKKAEMMKKISISKIGSTCMEITCQACRQRFIP